MLYSNYVIKDVILLLLFNSLQLEKKEKLDIPCNPTGF